MRPSLRTLFEQKQMPRIDDYKNARKLAIEALAGLSFDTILQQTGFESDEANRIRISFLDRVYLIRFPELEFEDQYHDHQDAL